MKDEELKLEEKEVSHIRRHGGGVGGFSYEFKFFYYEQIKREVKGIHRCGCRCNERLKKAKERKSLIYAPLIH